MTGESFTNLYPRFRGAEPDPGNGDAWRRATVNENAVAGFEGGSLRSPQEDVTHSRFLEFSGFVPRE